MNLLQTVIPQGAADDWANEVTGPCSRRPRLTRHLGVLDIEVGSSVMG